MTSVQQWHCTLNIEVTILSTRLRRRFFEDFSLFLLRKSHSHSISSKNVCNDLKILFIVNWRKIFRLYSKLQSFTDENRRKHGWCSTEKKIEGRWNIVIGQWSLTLQKVKPSKLNEIFYSDFAVMAIIVS